MNNDNFYGGGGQSLIQGDPHGYDPLTLSYNERAGIKKTFSGTFMLALLHGAGGYILAQIIFIFMMICGYTFRYTDDGTSVIDWQYDIAASIPSIIFCLGIFICQLAKGKFPLRSYFRTDRIKFSTVIGFFGVLMFAYAAAMILQQLIISGMFALGVSPISEESLSEPDLTPGYLVCEVIFTIILAPVAEELMFRGVILRRLSSVSRTFAIFVSAAIFGLMHGNLLQAVLGFIVGLVLGYTAVKTGSLVLPIAGHIFINTAASSSSFVQYFFGEDAANSCWTATILLFAVLGLIALIAVIASGRINLPGYTMYHRKRTFPIAVRCVSFWILLALYVIPIISACGPVTDKLLG